MSGTQDIRQQAKALLERLTSGESFEPAATSVGVVVDEATRQRIERFAAMLRQGGSR